MLTVSIYINGTPIITRSVRNLSKPLPDGRAQYQCDDGRVLLHNPSDGAIALAIQALQGVVEP